MMWMPDLWSRSVQEYPHPTIAFPFALAKLLWAFFLSFLSTLLSTQEGKWKDVLDFNVSQKWLGHICWMFFFLFFPKEGTLDWGRHIGKATKKKKKKIRTHLGTQDQIGVKKIQLILSMDRHPLLHPGTSTKHKGNSFRRMQTWMGLWSVCYLLSSLLWANTWQETI